MAGPLDWLQQMLGGSQDQPSGSDVLSRLQRYLATGGEALGDAPAGIAKGVGDIGQMMYGLAQRQGMAEAGLPPAPESELAPLGAGARTLSGLTDFLTGGYATGAVPRGAPFVAREAMAIPSLVADETGAIKAYHASPYDFERFDIGKVGTGQGSQAYGHGLYAAENPAVSGLGGQYDREFTLKNLGKQDFNQGEEQVFRSLAAGKSDLDILGEMARGGGYTFDEASQTLNRMRAAKAKIYETQINAEPEHFLDWDKKLSEQSDRVKEAIKQVYPSLDLSSVPTDALAARGPADKLREAGIPGIRYRDAGSRGPDPAAVEKSISYAQSVLREPNLDPSHRPSWESRLADLQRDLIEAQKPKTNNYVVFDDKLIEILRKYGIVPPLAAGGLLGAGSEPPT